MDPILVLLALFNFVASPVAVAGNSLVLHALWRSTSLHPPSKLLLGCLAITDLLIGLYAQPWFAVGILKSRSSLNFYNNVHADHTSIPKSTISLGIFSLFTVTGIALDRLLALHLRQRYRIVVTSRRLVVIQTFLFLFAVVVEVYWRKTGFYSAGVAIILQALIVVCILASTIAFARVCWKLRHHQLQVHGNIEHNNSSGSSLHMARYRKSVHTMLVVYVVFLISNLPHACASAVIYSGKPVGSFASTMILVTSSVLYMNSCVNPFLYCWRIRELRQIVLQSLRSVGRTVLCRE